MSEEIQHSDLANAGEASSEQQQGSVAAQQELKFHLFQDLLDNTRKTTAKLYSRTGLHSEAIEERFKQLNTISQPYLQRLTTLLDKQVDHTISSCQQFRESLEKQKLSIVARGKNSSLVRRADNLSTQVLAHLEQQIEQLSQTLQKQVKVSGQSAVNGGSSSNESEANNALSTGERTRRLMTYVNLLTKQIMLDQVDAVLHSSYAAAVLGRVQALGLEEKYLELKIFTAIVSEFLRETVQSKVVAPVQHYVVPAWRASLQSLTATRQYLVLTLQKLSLQELRQVVPVTLQKYQALRAGTVHIANQYVTIEFAQGFFERKREQIVTELKQFYQDLQNSSVVNPRQSALNLYAETLNAYKTKRALRLAILKDAGEPANVQREHQFQPEQVSENADSSQL